jgi:hypothetical protein
MGNQIEYPPTISLLEFHGGKKMTRIPIQEFADKVQQAANKWLIGMDEYRRLYDGTVSDLDLKTAQRLEEKFGGVLGRVAATVSDGKHRAALSLADAIKEQWDAETPQERATEAVKETPSAIESAKFGGTREYRSSLYLRLIATTNPEVAFSVTVECTGVKAAAALVEKLETPDPKSPRQPRCEYYGGESKFDLLANAEAILKLAASGDVKGIEKGPQGFGVWD